MMKKSICLKFIFLSSFILINSLIYSQEVIKKIKHINDTWDAEYEVLASDKKIKNGVYTVINTLNKKAIATGKYINNQQSGNWLYFDLNGNLIQRYNFDSKKLLFDDPMLFKDASYKFSFELSPTDSVSAPVKVGGFYYGFRFVFFQINNQALMYAMRSNIENCKLIQYLHIDENGKLTNWETAVKSATQERKFENPIDKLEEEKKLFYPAIYYKKPVSCIMMVEIDFKNNSVKKLPYQ